MRKTSKRTAASRKRSLARRVPWPESKVATAITAFAELARKQNLRWYLFGAQAVAAYGVPRTTHDIDLTIDLGDRRLAEIVAPLARAGFVARVSSERFARETLIYPVTHLPSGWKVDLVLAGPGIEQEFLEHARTFRVGRCAVPVIAAEHLAAIKVLASRPRDLEDVRGLIRVADLDHARVEETLSLLEAALDQSDLLPTYAQLRAEAVKRPQRSKRR